METPNIIAVGILALAVFAIIGIRIYTISKKQEKPLTFDEFMNIYGGQLIKVLQDTIVILQININEFQNKEQYEKAIISTTITKLKDHAKEFGIEQDIINLFSTVALTDMLYTFLHWNPVEVFSCLTPHYINDNIELYDNEVAAALTEA